MLKTEFEKCVFCGKQANQHHHMNPFNPVTVPICERCHNKLHQKQKVYRSPRKALKRIANSNTHVTNEKNALHNLIPKSFHMNFK